MAAIAELPVVQAKTVQRISHGDSANLDFLRSVAVLLVLFAHWHSIRSGTGSEWGLAWRLGNLGVLMFFVHTCLVLMWSMERLNLSGGKLFASFYTRRFFRLYPLSTACVMFAFFFDVSWPHNQLWQNLTLTQNLFGGKNVIPLLIGPIWSLPLEMQMYVLLPFLFLFFRNRSVTLLGIFYAFVFALSFAQPHLGERAQLLRFIPCFMGGILTWKLKRGRKRSFLPGWLWPIALIPVSMVWMTVGPHRLPWHVAAFGLALGLSITWFRELRWELLNKTTKLIARYSYGIYLTHFSILIFIFSNPSHPTFKYIEPAAVWLRSKGTVAHQIVMISLLVLIPVALYHLIEEPGIRLGKKLARQIA